MCALNLSTQSQQDQQYAPICYATKSGGTTIDRDLKGGNPFATALIDFSSSSQLSIVDFVQHLRERTAEISRGHQVPEWVGPELAVDWRLPHPQIGPKPRRVALVLVVSDYQYDPADLGGAAWDELRISAMLARNGFSVTQGVGSSRIEILRALQDFREVSCDSDFSIIYSTGHGCEAEGIVYLLPGDYPVEGGFKTEGLVRGGVSVFMLAEACSACTLNLVFFAGCRSQVT